MKKNNNKQKSSLSYPQYLVLIMLFFALGGFLTQEILFKNSDEGVVLSTGSGSDGDDDDDDSGSDSEDDDDEDSDEDEDDEDEEDENEIEDDDEDDDDDDFSNSGSSGSGSSGSSKSSSGSSNTESKTRTTVKNPDGTTTETRKEVENGKVKLRVITRDANGFKIEDKETEIENGKEESKVKTYSPTGEKLSEVELKTEDGKKLELKMKEGGTESKVKFNAQSNELEIESEANDDTIPTGSEPGDLPENHNNLKIKAVGNNFVLTKGGVVANSNFPMVVDTETGQVSVSTPNGLIELKAMPDTIVQKALVNVPVVNDISLDTNSTTPVVYKVSGQKAEKLFGVFNLNIPSSVIYDAQTGDFLKTEQTFITRVLDLFSF